MVNLEINSSGYAKLGNNIFSCCLGKNGVTGDKKEGDKKTPLGIFSIIDIYYRCDRYNIMLTSWKMKRISKFDGWCDDVLSTSYNCYVKLPFPHSHEKLWREDRIYDIIVVLSYNDSPVYVDKGSCIFMHVWREINSFTEGCITFSFSDLILILSKLTQESQIKIYK